MAAAIGLRDDFDGTVLRGRAKATKDAAQGRWLLALAEIYDGGSRSDGARIGAVGPQTVRDWVRRFNAHGPAGLIDGKAPGNPPKLNDAQRQGLAGVVETGPIPAIHGVVRWRRKDLAPLAEQVLEKGPADICGMTRAMISDPDMPNKARSGKSNDIRACIGCNQACEHRGGRRPG